jgi:putative pyruvate formate lyase activating enzyme
MRCRYCQNYPWSQDGEGREYDVEGLAEALRAVRGAGCHNVNLVSPTPWLPWIRAAAAQLRKDGVSIPFVYNTSGFERVEVLAEYRDLADVFLTDLRYAAVESAVEGSDTPGYVDAARAALEWMWREVGPLRTDKDGVAVRGVICRILILPGRAQEAVDSLRWIAGNIGTDIAISLMSQYVPASQAVKSSLWNRRISGEEYGIAVAALEDLGFANGWVQELEAEVAPELVGFKMKAGAG